MAAPILPNPSNFLGVALAINRSRDGPRFVFHYPAKILPVNARQSGGGGNGNGNNQNGNSNNGVRDYYDDDMDNEDDEAALLDLLAEPSSTGVHQPLPKGVDHLAGWNHDDHLQTESGSQVVPWEHVGGYPTKDLESLLTPARAYHKKLFQVSLDQLCFVSCPIYVPENGIWSKTKKKKNQQQQVQQKNGELNVQTQTTVDVPVIETTEVADEPDLLDETPTATAEEKKSGMTMFNLVFILHPKKHQVKELAETLYFHIIRKINKAYKYSQQRSDFVWKESKRILQLKDKGREDKTKLSVLWREILDVSSLAASMQDIYDAVSQNKIAALQLETAEGTVTHSVQIPVPFYLPDLQPPGSDGFEGLWMTTANSFAMDMADSALDDNEPQGRLDKTFALLLLHDEKKIIAELQADPDEATAAMVEFVRQSKPSTSFYAIAHHHGGAGGNNKTPTTTTSMTLSPAQVRKYAQHFIFWRRAIAIPPLHARDTYIMSPNANLPSLPRASQSWSKAFPLAPPLPNFLADLSAAPRPYKWHCPSKNHRPTYLAMLAWLMRGGWVTQLCTFAYVVVWPEIQYEVDYQTEADELSMAFASAANKQSPGEEDTTTTTTTITTMNPATSEAPLGSSLPTSSISTDSPPSSPTTTSLPDLDSPTHQTPTVPTLQTANAQAAEAARLLRLADREARTLAERAAQHARRPVPVATDHPSVAHAPHLAKLSPYIIVDAKRATGRDSLYLSAIGRRFRDARVRASWPVFWKYFNGRSALERVALLEDLKRKEAWGLLSSMGEYLVCVRHW